MGVGLGTVGTALEVTWEVQSLVEIGEHIVLAW